MSHRQKWAHVAVSVSHERVDTLVQQILGRYAVTGSGYSVVC